MSPMMMLPKRVSAGVLVATWLAACGGATTGDPPQAALPAVDASPAADSGIAGDDGAAPDSTADGGLVARAIVTMNGGAAGGCVTVPTMMLGDFGDPGAGSPPRSVGNGERFEGKAATVDCRIAPRPDGFEITATVALGDTPRLTLSGKTDLKGSSSAAAMTLAGERSWTSPSCTLDVSALSPQGGVAAGRYWGRLTCMRATNDLGATCDIFGQIRLENCRL